MSPVSVLSSLAAVLTDTAAAITLFGGSFVGLGSHWDLSSLNNTHMAPASLLIGRDGDAFSMTTT